MCNVHVFAIHVCTCLCIVFPCHIDVNGNFSLCDFFCDYRISDLPTTEEHCGVDLVAVKDSFKLLLEKFILPQHSRTDRNPVSVH